MKQSTDIYQFHKAFRQTRPENFSYDGREALFNYLEQMEQDCGEEMELDVIGLCCDFTESTLDEALEAYSLDSLRELKEHTTVIMVEEREENGNPLIIYQNF